jgi:hypothetical protein
LSSASLLRSGRSHLQLGFARSLSTNLKNKTIFKKQKNNINSSILFLLLTISNIVSATVICVNSGNKVFLFPSLSYYLLISTFFFLFFVIYTHARLDLIFLYFFKENETQQNQIYNQLFILFF